MPSKVEIFNRALIKLGAGTVISDEETSDKVTSLRVSYGPVRDAELRRNRWRFSVKRASLAADAATPAHGFSYQYPIPSDFLRLIQIGQYTLSSDLSDYRGGDATLFALEGRMILTNIGAPLDIRYVRRVEDPGVFDACFAESLAARLAFECCERITGSDAKKQLAWADYRNSIREAKLANALENASQDVADDSWVTCRS